jgi:hypothetical protein
VVVAVLLALASVVAILGLAIRFALRSAGDAASACDQDRRILLPAFVFTFGITIYSFLALLGWANPAFLFWTVIAALIVNGTGSLLLIAATDVATKAMGARRTRTWLIAGMAVFVGAATLALSVTMGVFSGRG